MVLLMYPNSVNFIREKREGKERKGIIILLPNNCNKAGKEIFRGIKQISNKVYLAR